MTTPTNALELCNACETEKAHAGCEGGYCYGCCPAHEDQPSAELETIARAELGLETLLERGGDSLDFHDLAVWSVRAALEAAYAAGRVAGAREARTDA